MAILEMMMKKKENSKNFVNTAVRRMNGIVSQSLSS